MKQLLLLFIIIFCSSYAWSQTQEEIMLKGRVYDSETRKVLYGASVACLYAKDSSKATITLTDKKGVFELDSLSKENYYLYITYLGYQPLLFSAVVRTEEKMVDLGSIAMKRTGLTLAQVDIVVTKSPLTIKKDTLEYSAGYFITREHATLDELLKKLPGVQVDMDGTIRVNGEIVKTILVEGRPFFANDPQLASKNLETDLIDKVQLIDRKVSQRDPTVSNDSQTEKAVNILIKKNKKNKFSGQLMAGYGSGNRFAAKTNIKRFKDHEHFTFLGNGNNKNENQNGVVISNEGIMRSWMTGINYNADLGKKLTINSNYIMSNLLKVDQRNSARQNFLKDSSYYYNRQSQGRNYAIGHRINNVINYKIDTRHTFIFTNTFNYNFQNYFQENSYWSYKDQLQLLNRGQQHNINEGKAYDISTNVVFDKKFAKAGRKFNVMVDYVYQRNDVTNYNKSNNLFVQPGGERIKDTLNQRSILNNGKHQIQFMVKFIEPVFKDKLLELWYGQVRYTNSSDKLAYDYNLSKNNYDQLIESLSNAFKNAVVNHLGSIGLSAQKKNYDYNVSLLMIKGVMNNTNPDLHQDIKLQTHTVLPRVFFNYTFTDSKRLRFNYMVNAQYPSVEQLQPVSDNSNPLYIKRGNPELKFPNVHQFYLAYNSFTTTMRSFAVNMNGGFTRNAIIDGSWVDSLGRQVSQPLNMNGGYNFRIGVDNSFPLTKQHTVVNAYTVFSLNKDINYVNGLKGNNMNLLVSQVMNYNYKFKELFDFIISGSVNYNHVQYSNQKMKSANYFTYNFSFDGNINCPSGIIIGSNLNYVLNTGRTAGYNTDFLMINAFVSKVLFPNRKGLLKLEAYDLLNRNVSINRIIGPNYMEDVQSKVLQRFFMLSFTYFLRKH